MKKIIMITIIFVWVLIIAYFVINLNNSEVAQPQTYSFDSETGPKTEAGHSWIIILESE